MAPLAPPAADRPSPRTAAALVVLLAAVAAALKLFATAPIPDVGHGDTGFYLTLARNLVAGRGFVIDYVPDFLSGAEGIPHPATTFWMPLVSVYLAAAMAIFGTSFFVAKCAMAALASLACVSAYLLGRHAFGARRFGLAAAAMMVVFEGGLTHVVMPQTHAVLLAVGPLWVLAVLRALEAPAALGRFVWVGVLTGVLQLTRNDGLFLWPALGLTWLGAGAARWSGGAWLRIALGFVVVMTPLWVLNVASFGRPMPAGWRAAFAVEYAQIYSLPESLTWSRMRQEERVVESRRSALLTNAASLATGPARGTDRIRKPSELEWHHWLVMGFAGVGAGVLLRRRFLVHWAYVGTAFAMHTLVFPETGRASLRCMLLASYALLFAAGAYGIERASVRLAGRKAGVAIATAAMLALVGITGAFSVLRARDWAARSSDWIVAARAEHHRILHEIVGPHAPARVMALDVHQLHANTGLPLVVIPYESEPVIHATALRLGVTHLLMRGAPERTGSGRSGLAEIPSRPSRWQQVESRAIGNDTVRLYRVVPPQ